MLKLRNVINCVFVHWTKKLTLKYEVFGKFSVIAVIKEAKTKSAVKAPINLWKRFEWYI